jgi:hypothetical protein
MARARAAWWAAQRGDAFDPADWDGGGDGGSAAADAGRAGPPPPAAAAFDPEAAAAEILRLRKVVEPWEASFRAAHGRAPRRADAAAADPAVRGAAARIAALRNLLMDSE